MCDTHVATIPASWAELEKEAVAETVTGGHTNGNGAVAYNKSSVTANPPLKSFLEGKAIRTVYGLVPLEYALDWPIFASYDELVGCASWLGGRIPTFEETQSLYAHANVLKRAEAERKLGKTVPAVNG